MLELAETGTFNEKIEELEGHMLKQDTFECHVDHKFLPGMYVRTIYMPADTWVVGHEHKTEHFNFVLKGKANVMVGSEVVECIEAPAVFVSGPGVRKVLRILEDMVWSTTHMTDKTDIAELEEELIVKSPTWLEHHNQLEADEKKELGGDE